VASKKKVSILVPTLNEEEGLQKTLDSLPKEKILEFGYELEVLVIDGGSTDLTRDVATQFDGVKIILEKRNGYGRAYKTGFAAARGDIIVTLDADGSYPVELIPNYIHKLVKDDLDFITINRFSGMEKGAMTISHQIGNKILSFGTRLLYSISIKDSQSGMWIIKKELLEQIKLNSDNMCFSEEIKIIAFKFFRSLELDGKYHKRCGTVKIKTFEQGWHNLKYLFQYRKMLKNATRSAAMCFCCSTVAIS
jgi:dolichol-phosphate hexosyltransferase